MPQAEGHPQAQQLEPPSLSVSVTVPHKFNGTMQLHYLKSHNICWYDSFITVNLYIYLLIKEVILGDTSSLLGNNCPMLYILYMLYKQSKICKSQCLVDSVLQGETGTRRGPFWGHHGSGWGLPAESPSCWALTRSGAGSGPACGSLGAGRWKGQLWEREQPRFPSLPRGAQQGLGTARPIRSPVSPSCSPARSQRPAGQL